MNLLPLIEDSPAVYLHMYFNQPEYRWKLILFIHIYYSYTVCYMKIWDGIFTAV